MSAGECIEARCLPRGRHFRVTPSRPIPPTAALRPALNAPAGPVTHQGEEYLAGPDAPVALLDRPQPVPAYNSHIKYIAARLRILSSHHRPIMFPQTARSHFAFRASECRGQPGPLQNPPRLRGRGGGCSEMGAKNRSYVVACSCVRITRRSDGREAEMDGCV